MSSGRKCIVLQVELQEAISLNAQKASKTSRSTNLLSMCTRTGVNPQSCWTERLFQVSEFRLLCCCRWVGACSVSVRRTSVTPPDRPTGSRTRCYAEEVAGEEKGQGFPEHPGTTEKL